VKQDIQREKKVGWDFGPLAIDWTINHGRYMLE